MWQVLVSLLYTAFNIILASQLVALEWSSYGDPARPKGLRVSRPDNNSAQRSTHYLSMPYRYALPTMSAFFLAHFLVSQSTFVIRLLTYNWDGKSTSGRTMAGFSPIPSFLGLVFTTLLFAAYILNGALRRYRADPRMPLVGTNSLAISANCHRPANDKEAHRGKVAWGVVVVRGQREVGRCTFASSHVVQRPGDEENIFGLEEKVREKEEASKPRQWREKWRGWKALLGIRPRLSAVPR